MPKQQTVNNSFSFGEVSPRALGQFAEDKPIWKRAAAKIENFLNFKIGGVMFFPGTTYIANTKTNGAKIRLQEIAYSISQAYVLELGALYMRFYSNVNGVPGQVIVAAGAPVDSYTVLLSHFDGLNGATAYTAEVGGAVSFFGTAQIDTSQFKFGTSSLKVSAGADKVTLPDSANWDFGSGDYTIEFWARTTADGDYDVMEVGQSSGGGSGIGVGFRLGSADAAISINGVNNVLFGTFTWTANTWYHFALVRNGGGANNTALYVNGTLNVHATDNSIITGSTEGVTLGCWNNPFGVSFNGWIDEVRISKGIARYTGAFTPPTLPFGGANAWLTGTLYHVGDYVTQSGTVYVCLVQHTSGTFATDLANGDWSAQKQLEVVTPYALADVFKLQFAGKQDVTYIVGSGYAPQKLSRLSSTSFTLAPVQTIRGPFLALNATSTTITPSAATGAGITLTASQSIFQAGHVGALFRVNSDATHGACVLITAYTSGTVVTGTVQAEPDGTAGNIGGTGAYTNWQEGAISAVRGYPTSVVFHEGRLVYGINDFFYASKVNQYDNFDSDAYGHSTGYAGSTTITDASAYSYQLATNQFCSIRWLSSNTSLEIGTTGGTFTASGGQNGITPTAISVVPDSDYNVFSTQPEKMSSYLYYLDGNSYTVRQLVFDLGLNKQKSEDMTMLADHILRDGGGATQMAHQKSPNDRLWVVRADGQLAVFTRDTEQQVLAWCRRIAGASISGNGVIESVAIMPMDGTDDQIWASVQRNINGTVQRFIEVFNKELPTNYWEYNNLDASLTYDNPTAITGITNAAPGVITAPGHTFSNGNQVKIDGVVGLTGLNATAYLVANVSGNTFTLQTLLGVDISTVGMGTYLSAGQVRLMQTTFTGLSYLNGEKVMVQADGVGTTTQYTVSAGSITLGSPAAVVHVGLPYTGKLQLLPLNPQTKMQRAYLATLRVFKSLGGKLGFVDSFGNVTGLLNLPYPEVGYTANSLYSGDLEQFTNSDYNKSQSILIQQDTPNPLFVLAAVTVQEANDR